MDKNETGHIARLARLKFEEKELDDIAGDLSKILGWIDELQNADTSALQNEELQTPLRTRKDLVTEGGIADELLKNAPEPYEHFFTVPRVVE